jgi:hypothetical protein
LHGFFPQNFISVALHPYGSTWTEPSKDALDLRSEAATEYFNFFGRPDAFPMGTVDMAKYNEKSLLKLEDWAAAVVARIVQNTDVALQMECSIDERTLTVKPTVITEKTENLSLILWLTESKIYGKQMNNGVLEENYEHNHILRAAINGIWGEKISENYSKKFQIDEKWNIANCSVVGVVINAEKEIVAACEIEL